MTRPKTCILVPAPVEAGAGRRGADMGARAFRAAGIAETLRDLGLEVIERAPVAVGSVETEAPSQCRHWRSRRDCGLDRGDRESRLRSGG